MGLSIGRRRAPQEPALAPERGQVRDYRRLLARLPADELQSLHVQALAALDPLTRASILRTAQARLLSGAELTVDDVRALARLLVIAETRTTGAVVAGLDETPLERLAAAVVTLERRRAEATAEAAPEAAAEPAARPSADAGAVSRPQPVPQIA